MDDDDKASSELRNGRLSKIAQGEPITSAKQIVDRLSPAFSGAEIAHMETMRKMLGPVSALTEQLNAIQPLAIDHAKFVAIAGIIPSIDPKVITATQCLPPLNIDPSLASVVRQARRLLGEAMSPVGSMCSALKQFEEQQLTVPKSLLASLAGPFGDVAKTSQWMRTLSQIDTPDIAKSLGGGLGIVIDDMRAVISKGFIGSTAANQAKLSEMLGLTIQLGGDFAATKLKMSVIAGIAEAYGRSSHFQHDAYYSLFGEWRTRLDLPANFWRDERVRERMYREANVDEGLIIADPGMALEIMIESGLAAGVRSDGNAVAVVRLGDVSMTVRSHGASRDAYALVEQFELKLRAYIERKLEERFSPDWFRQRASNLIGKAKAIRKEAVASGETSAPLINYTDLGDLSGIIMSTKNWDEVFEDVFVRKNEFAHDMQKLVAVRRPTMHMRQIDGVRLVEAICVIQRLSKQMDDDGAWKAAAETDR